MFTFEFTDDYDYGTEDGAVGTMIYSVQLKFNIGDLTFFFDPEYPEHIRDVDITAESGRFDTSPSNGGFSLEWSPTVIRVSVAKYGDGRGGTLDVTVKANPEMLESLKSALREWKALFP